MRFLAIGDIVGDVGCRVITNHLPSLIRFYKADQVIANGENAFKGKGLNLEIAQLLFSSGVNVITSGNHIWDQREIFDFIHREDRIIRPANYPAGTPGLGLTRVWAGSSGVSYVVINLMGRAFMSELDCPFTASDKILKEIASDVKIILVDFHAEATSEKMALAHYLKGRVSAVFGTHTHVQTSDEQILAGHTGYITDLGMTGPHDSILGVDTESVLYRFTTQLPVRFKTAQGRGRLDGILLDIDEKSGRTGFIERIQIFE